MLLCVKEGKRGGRKMEGVGFKKGGQEGAGGRYKEFKGACCGSADIFKR